MNALHPNENLDEEAFFLLVTQLLESDLAQARETLLQRISTHPEDHRARLLYAKALYLDKHVEHAVRELIELRRRRDTPSLRSLLASFGAIVSQFEVRAVGATPEQFVEHPVEDKTLGEIDFDLSILDES